MTETSNLIDHICLEEGELVRAGEWREECLASRESRLAVPSSADNAQYRVLVGGGARPGPAFKI